MDSCPSGRQVEIAYNGRRATVDEVGGGEIRCYEVGGRSVFDPFPIDTICDGAHGAPRIPWPNRLVDGHYRFHDEHRLPACPWPCKAPHVWPTVVPTGGQLNPEPPIGFAVKG